MDRPVVRRVLLGLLVAVAGWHLVVVTLAAIPPNQVSQAAEPAGSYLDPYFTQNWRLFAPNPVAADRHIRIQGAYRDGDRVVQTAWIDWTDVELDLVHHRVVGNRGGYVTNKAIDSLGRAYGGLGEAGEQVTSRGSDAEPPSWRDLGADLTRAGVADAERDRYLRYERAMARLASAVVASREPGRDWVAVRYSVVNHPVRAYAARHETARPPERERLSGWRTSSRRGLPEDAAIADFDARHR